MMPNADDSPILVVDDDFVTLALIRKTLEKHGFRVIQYESAWEALDHYGDYHWQAVLSDYYMAGMDGREFLRHIRESDQTTPFLFLTANDDLGTAVELIKLGADDFIIKPIVEEIIIFRVEHAIRDREQKSLISRIERERELLETENRKLVSWRTLYGTKDIAQTQQMIKLLSRYINQSGGFLWVDLLRGEMESSHRGEHFHISEAVARLALEAAEGQREVFEFISFIADLDNMELAEEEHATQAVMEELYRHVQETRHSLEGDRVRELSLIQSSQSMTGRLRADMTVLGKVVHELFINAVKFSPPESRVYLGFEQQEPATFAITLRNEPVRTRAVDQEGTPVTGIPYDYGELVFDLFYSIDGFPVEIEQEEWRYGTGLYICRHLLQRMNGTINASNGVDYSGGERRPFVQLQVTLPLVSDPA